MKFDEIAVVDSQTQLSEGIFDMWISTENVAKNAVPGQFILRMHLSFFQDP